MDRKDRDYIKLLRFQKSTLILGDRIREISKNLNNASEEASALLQDTVSHKTICRIRDCAAQLDAFAVHIIQRGETDVRKTVDEIQNFEAL